MKQVLLQALPIRPRVSIRYNCGFQPQNRSSMSGSSIEQLLSRPSWSVKSLLPTKYSQDADGVSSNRFNHLLRLSALPAPSTPEEETRMLETLNNQLHFVNEIQKLDTDEVEPLRSLRDETQEGQKECEIGFNELEEALNLEETKGKHYKRVRRRQNLAANTKDAEEWDVLGHTERKVGKFFVVENIKETES